MSEENTNENQQLNELVDKYIKDIDGMSLYKKTEYLFNTLWYETGIPDFSAPFVRDAMNNLYPKEETKDYDLHATLYTMLAIAKDCPYIEAAAVVKVIDTILMPVARGYEQEWLEGQLKQLEGDVDEV